ncbi:MAG: S1 RNA-binding domain-containing protein [Candidatus Aenigmatarchaeota archaeon]
MVRKRGLPSNGELVVCRIERLNPNSAFAVLLEYNREGMIHISEVSSGWVRDIRNHVRAGQELIAKVIGVDENHLNLSIKRVDKKEEKRRMKEYNLDQKAERMLEIVTKELGKDLNKAYDEVGYLLQENFGSLFEGFKKAIQNPTALRERGIAELWIKPIKEIAEKSIEQKEFEFSARITVKTSKPDGISIVKNILSAAEKSGLEVKYISAPEYMVKYKSKDAKKGGNEFQKMLDRLSANAEVKVI